MSVFTNSTVVSRVLEHARTQPDHTALTSWDESLTYAELGQRIVAVSHALSRVGVTRGSRVGISMPRSIDALVVVLASHLCGAAYVPLDPELPVSRLAVMHDLAGLAVVVIQAGRTPPSWTNPDRCVSVEDLTVTERAVPERAVTERAVAGHAVAEIRGNGTDTRPVPTFESPTGLDDEAYLIFTSGSTGAPKGVTITHRNLAALMNGWNSVMGTDSHVSLWLSALSFDASVAEIFWPLHRGGTLAIAPAANAPAGLGLSLGNFIEARSVTHVQCTPTRATLLLADDVDRAALGRVRHLVIGGETLPSSLARDLLNAGIARITNAYGPTEATVWATTHEVTADSLNNSIVSIGSELPGMYAAIIDGEGKQVAVGDVGELVLGGEYVSSGYLARGDLTEHAFSHRDFGSGPLWTYRTGDLAARDNDGSLTFHGRADGQVKIRGHRIELGEIEAVLNDHPAVRHAVVVLDRRHVALGAPAQDLVAVVSPAEVAAGTSTSGRRHDAELAASLRSHIAARLPAIMVPRSMVMLDSLPQTTSGKLDRVAIKELLGGERTKGASTARPDDLAALVDDFRAVLPHRPHAPMSESTDFFDAGGHSLLVVELIRRIEERTTIKLPLSALLEAPTPQLLLRVLASPESKAHDPLVAFEPRPDTLVSPDRPRLYFIHGAGGHVLRFRQMAMAIAADVEVIGVQAVGVEGDQQPDQDLAAMVERYAEAIAGTDSGPLHLGGYSDGGVIAGHVAHRLVKNGIIVRSLVFADTFAPQPFPSDARTKLRNIAYNAAHRDGLGLRQWMTGAFEGWRRRTDWDAEGAAALKRLGYNDLFDQIERAVRNGSTLGSVDAPAMLLRTYTENPVRRRDYSFALTTPRSTETRWVLGKHDEMFTDNGTTSEDLAALIRTWILNHR